MAHYVDGFVVPVPKKNVEAYRKSAKLMSKVCRELGALEYYECIADDVKPGKVTSFPQSVKLKSNEVVFFSWIVYKSRAQRNKIMKQVMADPRIQEMGEDMMPFDGQRMIYGGFRPFVAMPTGSKTKKLKKH